LPGRTNSQSLPLRVGAESSLTFSVAEVRHIFREDGAKSLRH
jgi:hypothetical protein